MQSVYNQDIGKLWIILLISLLFSISLIGYSFSYKNDHIDDDNFKITTVYNSGKNTCCTLNNDYKVSVMGYNKTNEDVEYQIYVKLDDDFLGENMIFIVINKESNLYQEFDLTDITDNEFKIGNFKISKNVDNYLEEYHFILKSNENKDVNFKKNIEISVRY